MIPFLIAVSTELCQGRLCAISRGVSVPAFRRLGVELGSAQSHLAKVDLHIMVSMSLFGDNSRLGATKENAC